MGDQFTLSGDFRGAVVNIKSTLTQVQQSVGEMHTPDIAARQELSTLIGQLNDVLQQVPPARQEQAEAVALSARLLVETARTEKPNPTLLQISGEGLKQAAANLMEVVPAAAALAVKIVSAVARMVTLGG